MKTSRTVVIAESRHDRIDDPVGILLSLAGQMEILHGGLETGVSEIALNNSDIHSGLKKMGGVAVAKGMNGYARLADARFFLGPDEGALDTGTVHGEGGGCSLFAASSASGEDEHLVSMGEPVPPEQLQGLFGDGDVAVFGAFSPVDMNQLTHAVDIGQLQIESFLKTKSAGVDGGKKDIVVESPDRNRKASRSRTCSGHREVFFHFVSVKWRRASNPAEGRVGNRT